METNSIQSSIHNHPSTIHTWRVVAASVAGVSHVRSGTPCQDAHAYCCLPNGVLIAAVADGAGSAAQGREGAAIAVEAVMQTLKCRLQTSANGIEEDWSAGELTTALRHSLSAARAALEAKADGKGEALRELATTLIVAIARQGRVAVAQVGDGAAAGMDTNGTVFALTTPPDAEYANATTFLTAPDALDTAQVVVAEQSVVALSLFSDGLQRLALKLPEGVPHVPFFTPLFRFAVQEHTLDEAQQQLASFLRSPRITDRADDDLTLLLAAYRGDLA